MSQDPFIPHRYGRFYMLDRIGRGGMAEVYRAKILGVAGFEKEIAIKRILPNLMTDDEFVTMFIDEAKLTVALNHANIVQVHELGDLEGAYYIAMEFVHGKDLLDLLATCSKQRLRIPTELALFIVREVLRGLHCAHNASDSWGEPLNIIHRDVSPSNIMLTYAGQVKVGDFGIAKSGMQSSATQVGIQKGKLGYMSPEQVVGGKIDGRSDVFAAGVILYETLTMMRMFKARNELDVMLKIRDVNIEHEMERARKRLSDPLAAIIRKALAKDLGERFKSASEFDAALRDYMYTEQLHVDSNDLSRFMREVFLTEIQAEKDARANDDAAVRSLRLAADRERAIYRYRSPDGLVFGPMNLQMMGELLRSRPPEPTERAAVVGNGWLPISSIDALSAIARTPDESLLTQSGIIDPDRSVTPSAERRERAGVGKNPHSGAAQRDVAQKLPPNPQPVPSSSTPNERAAGPASDFEAAERRPSSPRVEGIKDWEILSGKVEPTPDPRRAKKPSLDGSLKTASFAKLLYRLHVCQIEGRLSIRRGDDLKDLYFARGIPGIIESNIKTERLGDVIIARGTVPQDKVDLALSRAGEFGGRLGDALVALGIMQPNTLFECLTTQLDSKLVDLFNWFDASWEWYPGDAADPGAFPLPIDVPKTIVRGLGEHCDVNTILATYRQYGGAALIRGPVDVGELSHIPAKVLNASATVVVGENVYDTVNRLRSTNRWSEEDALRSLFMLTEHDLLRFEGIDPVDLPR